MSSTKLKKLAVAVVGLTGCVLGQEVELIAVGFQPNNDFPSFEYFLGDSVPETDLFNRKLYARGFRVVDGRTYEHAALECQYVSWQMTLSDGSGDERVVPMSHSLTDEGCPAEYHRPEQPVGNGGEIPLPVSITLSYNYTDQETDEIVKLSKTAVIERPSWWPCGDNFASSDTFDPYAVIATLEEDGTMTFRGSGIIRNMPWAGSHLLIPWLYSTNFVYKAVIESGISYIGYGLFLHLPNLTSVTIGALDENSEVVIGGELFGANKSLTSVTVLYSNPPTVECPHYTCPPLDFDKSSVTLYVPAGSIEAYQSATYWQDFGDIQPVPNTTVRSRIPAPTVPSAAPAVSVIGKTLCISGEQGAGLQVRMIDMRGKTVLSRKVYYNDRISLSNIPAGRYIVDVRRSGVRVGTSAVVVR